MPPKRPMMRKQSTKPPCRLAQSSIIAGSRKRRVPGTRRFLLPAMMLLWANLHGGFVLCFLIIGLFGGIALLKRDWANFRVYAFVGVACLVATLINPLGAHIYDGVAGTLGKFVQDHITEGWAFIH